MTISVDEYREHRRIFNQNLKLSSLIRKWENEVIEGIDVSSSYPLTNIHHRNSQLPKGMISELSPINPLFTDFVIYGHAAESKKSRPDIIYEESRMILFYNNKLPIKVPDIAYEASSYIHLLAIPCQRIYNAVSLTNYHLSLLRYLHAQSLFLIRKYYRTIICTTLARVLVTNPINFLRDFNLVNPEPFKSLLVKALAIYRIYYSNPSLAQILEDNLVIPAFEETKLKFLLHLAPHNSIGHLHIHCIYEPLATPVYYQTLPEMVSLDTIYQSFNYK